jgi:DNA-binding CsgD family transcriptional regulator
MNGKAMLSRRVSAAACAVFIATSIGSTVTEAQENQAIESIDRYCRASWRNARIDRQDWEECTQQTFAEMLDRVSRDRWIEAIENTQSHERRELNRSIWRVAQRWRRSPRFQQVEADQLGHTTFESDRSDRPRLDEVLQMIDSPDSGLTPRQQDVLRRWVDGNSVAEIATQLDVTPARVSDEKYKAIQKLRAKVA